MKIIGGHDYYDCALSLGIDPTIKLLRGKSKRVPVKEAGGSLLLRELEERGGKPVYGAWPGSNFYCVAVVFCNKVYRRVMLKGKGVWSADKSTPVQNGASEETTTASTEPSPSEAAPSSSESPITAPEPTPAAAEEPSEPSAAEHATAEATSTPTPESIGAEVVSEVQAIVSHAEAIAEETVAQAKASVQAGTQETINAATAAANTAFTNLRTAVNSEVEHANEVLSILRTSSSADASGTIVYQAIQKLSDHIASLQSAVK